MKIDIQTEIYDNRQDVLWYGGIVATIEYQGYKFSLEAVGDVNIELFDMDNKLIESVNDKNNDGKFKVKMQEHIKDDAELIQILDGLHPEKQATINNNNWWEIFVTDKDGAFHDLSAIVDDTDNILEAIASTILSLKYIIIDLEKKYKIKTTTPIAIKLVNGNDMRYKEFAEFTTNDTISGYVTIIDEFDGKSFMLKVETFVKLLMDNIFQITKIIK